MRSFLEGVRRNLLYKEGSPNLTSLTANLYCMHGGQVRLPFVGPLLTLARVPRSWTAGLTVLGPDKTFVVSRWIGMERVNAPQMRFLCLPEIVILDLAPVSSPSQ